MSMTCTKNTVAVDFDGVIHRYSQGWKDGSIYDVPIRGVHSALMELRNDYWVYIFTTRNVQDVVEWMNRKFWLNGEQGFSTVAIPEDVKFWQDNKMGVSNRKLPAEFYIDDRGIRFTNWEKTLKEIKFIRDW